MRTCKEGGEGEVGGDVVVDEATAAVTGERGRPVRGVASLQKRAPHHCCHMPVCSKIFF